MEAVQVRSFSQVTPMIYAYTTPGVPYQDGWIKIGYTEKQSVEQRIHQQTHTAGVQVHEEWRDNAIYKDGSGQYFTDHEFHDYLEANRIHRRSGTEWFELDPLRSLQMFQKFARREAFEQEGCTYTLREEQHRAVEMTKEYFENGGDKFLWNAKPRFGKTLTSYDLVCRMGFDKVLIVTNRPSIANSWADDFRKFIGWQKKLVFVSDTDALRGHEGVMTREEYTQYLHRTDIGDDSPGMVAFESLQGLKGSVYFGGQYNKLQWVKENSFDLLIVDEAQEGVDTVKTDRAFDSITRKHTLYLSGTPFKQLASDQFAANQIFNWSYSDEQEAKANWDKNNSDAPNPYATLPKMSLLTYQLSPMIREELQQGIDLSGEDGTVDYAFDLNEFFATTETGKLVHEEEIRKFLRTLVTGEKYPFSTPELRKELSHTLWLLNRVASVKALAKLLQEDETFCDYEIVLAAGDGKLDNGDVDDEAIDRVREAIRTHEKTITLSVGQLTVGVTIPQWSAVLMLCNLKSPSSYIQAAFRAQNPCMIKRDGTFFRKETAYVFDFDPARTLTIYGDFACNLNRETVNGGGTVEDREANIKRLLNFFPVLGEDSEGRMVELDAGQVLDIPRKLKSEEVVRHGFMSNLLFCNIGNVFGAPGIVKDIVSKLNPAHEDKVSKKDNPLNNIDNVHVNEEGEAEPDPSIVIGTTQDLFGPKVYENIQQQADQQLEQVIEADTPIEVKSKVDTLVETVKEQLRSQVIQPVADQYDLKNSTRKRIEQQVEHELDRKFDKLRGDYEQQVNIAKAELDNNRKTAETEEEAKAAEDTFGKSMDDAMQTFLDTMRETIQTTVQNKPQELVQQLEKQKAEREKKSIEDSVRDHLRGFTRTIPSFIMAYGDENLTLQNFDTYTEENVFEEVTGITLDNFRFLRDGGDYTDEETGEQKHFPGHIFEVVTLNDSIRNFWNKKNALADYFNETHTEDIFDFIPPQKTNQIFTPKWVVKKMVDELEAENPGCYDDPDHTFADLYMKSGLYITEVVKKLFNSEAIKELYPDEDKRIRHILTRQVYGMAPTRIIYLIATNFIFGGREELLAESHFVEADAAEASKNGTLKELVDRCFGQ